MLARWLCQSIGIGVGRRAALVILALAAPAKLPAAEFFDLRLQGALSSDDAGVRDWVLSPRLRFTMVDGEASHPVIELKRGWVVPSWKGVVDSIGVEREGGDLKGVAEVRVHSSIGVTGAYRISFEAKPVAGGMQGSFVSTGPGARRLEGSLRGSVHQVAPPVIDPEESVWTVQLVGALPKGETLTVYLNRSGGQFTSAFALSPNASRRPMEVDAKRLKFSDGRLAGSVSVSRLNAREPDGGERSSFGQFNLEAKLEGAALRGRHSGGELEGVPEGGGIWGEIRPRRALPESTEVWVKLEDGYTGGAMWQNRVFFKATLGAGGGLVEGKADNNKGVFEAELTGAQLALADERIVGMLHSTVHESGSVRRGDYSFRLVGSRAGDVLCGRFYTSYAGEESHTGYFVGGIDR